MTAPRSTYRRAVAPRDLPRPDLRPRPLPRRAAPADTAAETLPDMTAIERASSRGLDGFTFFVANLQTGFGPFLAVYFTQAKWTQSDIGFALTVGSLVSLLGQVPGGAFVDAVRSRRFAAGLSVVAIAGSAFALAAWPSFIIVLLAMAVHSAASCILTPAIAAISIGLVGHARAGERLGRNASFSALGNAVAAAVMGACGYYISNDAVFYFTAALMLPTLVALSFVRPPTRPAETAARRQPERQPDETRTSLRALLTNRTLICFAACMSLFFLANAAMLPLVGSMLTMRASETATALIAACIVVPQVVLALTGPAIGRAAERWGRRPLLLIGFAALPIRGLLFAYTTSPELLVAIQVFDGISAAVFGVMVPLVVSDATRHTGRFNTALGAVGTAMGIGAALSTSLAGIMADKLGSQSAFLGLAIVGFAGFALLALIMPETRREPT
ncbi:MAG: MFS transporter [Methylobacterium sp.]|uniref:MFS transporter n=1 Tax=Methylobacterium sp. TaxID=409 RepID=UPI0025E239F6|nr:MFS transporter [Methylobacterium sp.]MBX9932239.1 MFS transporter [Methylobacterium sp.]